MKRPLHGLALAVLASLASAACKDGGRGQGGGGQSGEGVGGFGDVAAGGAIGAGGAHGDGGAGASIVPGSDAGAVDGGDDGAVDGGAPGSWYELAGSATASGVSIGSTGCDEPAMALDPQGNPLVAWSGGIGTVSGLRFRRWSGTAWEDLGGSDSMAATVCTDTLVDGGIGVGVFSDASPLIMCPASPADVKRWTGSAWVGLTQTAQGTVSAVPGPSNALDRHQHAVLAMSPAGIPTVVWDFQAPLPNNESYVFLETWAGAGWQALGASAASTGLSGAGSNDYSATAAVGADGRPYVAWLRFTSAGNIIMMEHWNGTGWDTLPNAPIATAARPAKRLLSTAVFANGTPAIAYAHFVDPTQATIQSEVLVKVYDGIAWQGLGGSDQSGGVSGQSGSVAGAAVSADDRGRLLVAWQDHGQIYLRRWTGSGWQELGGSASGGGVSQCSGACRSPAVAARGARTCVAWVQEDVAKIHVRCFSDGP